MVSMKGVTDAGIAFMIIIGLFMLLFVFISQSSDLFGKALGIRHNADVVLELNDGSTGLISVMESRTDRGRYLDHFIREMEGMETVPGAAEEIDALLKEMDLAIIVYDADGEEVAYHGDRKLGSLIKADVPLPGGRKGSIGLVSDVVLPEDMEIAGESTENGEDGVL